MQRLADVRAYEIDRLNFPQEPPKGWEMRRLSGKLELAGVSFGYSPLEPPLIEDFNMCLLPGRWTAVVGASGSGKSTLAKLVTGLYAPWAGEILLDGHRR